MCLKGYQLRLQIFFIMGLSLEWEALLLEESVRELEFYFSDEPSSNIWTCRFEDLWHPALMEPSKTNCTIENAWQFGGLARDDPWDPAGGFVLRYCTMKKEILHVVLSNFVILEQNVGHVSYFIFHHKIRPCLKLDCLLIILVKQMEWWREEWTKQWNTFLHRFPSKLIKLPNKMNGYSLHCF